MKTIPETFRKSGFDFEQVKRAGNWAIYRKRKPVWTPGIYSFEVVKIRSRKETVIFGRTVEAGEYYPASEEWGRAGFSYPDIGRAERKLSEVTTGSKAAKVYCGFSFDSGTES